ncbi:MAG: hypothetical protein ABSF63_02740 [Candidatus Bathyarchaeia archaeon]
MPPGRFPTHAHPYQTTPSRMTTSEFDQIFERVCNCGRWGPDDQLGTLNYITPDHIRAAAALVRTGQSVSLAIPINTVAGPDNPQPAFHYIVQAYDTPNTSDEPRFALDYPACEFHGDYNRLPQGSQLSGVSPIQIRQIQKSPI